MRRLGSTLCIATLSWLTGMALPATSKADIVLHDGGVSRDKDAAERVTDRTGTAPTLILSSEVLSGPTRLLAGHAQVEQCEGAPIPLDIEGKLQEIEEHNHKLLDDLARHHSMDRRGKKKKLLPVTEQL